MNTNWSSPKTNIIAGLNDLRKALASGQNAVLVKARNEDCAYPIRVKKHDTDFRNYEFNVGYMQTRSEILRDKNMDDFHKYLTLNFKACHGTPDAINRYYESGCLSKDNFKGMGTCHLVKVEDMVRWLLVTGDTERAEMFKKQYLSDDMCNDRHFWDFYRYKHGSQFAPKHFKTKLWVVELLGDNQPKAKTPVLVKIMNALMYPLKYIPRRSVLKMNDYTNYTFRIGDVVHGFAIEFQIPKKFSFN